MGLWYEMMRLCILWIYEAREGSSPLVRRADQHSVSLAGNLKIQICNEILTIGLKTFPIVVNLARKRRRETLDLPVLQGISRSLAHMASISN